MCRFTIYRSKRNAILLANLILKPIHSIVKQSYACTMRVSEHMQNLNGDGFGVGWYDTHSEPNPTTDPQHRSHHHHHHHAQHQQPDRPGCDVLPNRIDVAGDCDDNDESESSSSSSSSSSDADRATKRARIESTVAVDHTSTPSSVSSSSSSSSSSEELACESVVLRKRADPCVFTSITPAWNNINLRRLSEKIRSHTFFAHVRAATPGLITSETNSHPFQYKQFMFMHNGGVARWDHIKRALLFSIRPKFFTAIQGSTDSELVFYLILNEIENIIAAQSVPLNETAEIYKKAIIATIHLLVRSIDAAGPPPANNEATLLNLALTDGDIVCCTKFVYPPTAPPASLYFTSGTEFTDPSGSGQFRMIQQDKRQLCYIFSSEPLSREVDDWIPVPIQSIITVNEESNFLLETIPLKGEPL